jgi:hypothetical protein
MIPSSIAKSRTTLLRSHQLQASFAYAVDESPEAKFRTFKRRGGQQEQIIWPDRTLDTPDGARISMSNLTRGLELA